jgi:TldD protein
LRLSTVGIWAAAGALAASCLVCVSTGTAIAAVPGPSLLSTLKSELDREFNAMKTKADPAPYYMAYEVTDEETESAVATLGALVSSVQNHTRGLDTTIRVGSPQFDNYHPLQGNRFRFTNFTRLSLDDDPDQIRRTLWRETDRVYEAGSRRLLQLKTDQQLLAEQKDHDPDFSAETPATYTSEPPRFPVNLGAWEKRLRALSAEFKSHDLILGSQVAFRQLHETKTFADTEGGQIQTGSNLLRVEIGAQGLASDGMEVNTFSTVEASDPSHLPSEDQIQTRVKEVADKVDALVKAPPAEPIVCPAILSGRAAAVFFHEIFGHRVEGHRQKNLDEGQTFTKMLGQKVLPDFIGVKFDPSLTQLDGHDLIGHYEYDDEGVKGMPVQVVQAGVLKTFLLSRSPVGEFAHSNGHGRRQPGFEPESRQSNLIVESSKQVTNAQLRAMLIAEIKRQVKPYGLYFEEVASGYTTTSRRGLQAFTVVPLVVYRVYADGRPDELIRGVDIVGTPLASFQRILATSDHPEVFNGYCGAESGSIPVSAVSPAILVSEIETEKKRNQQEKQPILPRPGASQYHAVFE